MFKVLSSISLCSVERREAHFSSKQLKKEREKRIITMAAWRFMVLSPEKRSRCGTSLQFWRNWPNSSMWVSGANVGFCIIINTEREMQIYSERGRRERNKGISIRCRVLPDAVLLEGLTICFRSTRM